MPTDKGEQVGTLLPFALPHALTVLLHIHLVLLVGYLLPALPNRPPSLITSVVFRYLVLNTRSSSDRHYTFLHGHYAKEIIKRQVTLQRI